MKLHILDLPDSQAGLADWLEMHLTAGDSLNALVAELTAVAGPVEAPASLQDVLSPADRAVMESGLSAASLECLQQLLRQPDLLLDLQERVLLEAHPYWESRIRESTSHDTDAGWDALQKSMSSVSAPRRPGPRHPLSHSSHGTGRQTRFPFRTAAVVAAGRMCPADRSGDVLLSPGSAAAGIRLGISAFGRHAGRPSGRSVSAAAGTIRRSVEREAAGYT